MPGASENGGALSLIRDALLLSTPVLAMDSSQLAGQLIGRLGGSTEPDVQRLVAEASAWRARPWLRPLTASLTSPGGPMTHVLTGLADWVTSVAMAPDGRRVAAGSYNRKVQLWDLPQGMPLARTVLPGTGFHAEGRGGDGIGALALLGDARRAVAVSIDRCIDLVDAEAGRRLSGESGWTDTLWAVAVTPDGRRAVSALRDAWGWDDRRLHVFDVERNEEIAAFELGQASRPVAVALSADGLNCAVACDDGSVAVWRVDGEQDQRLAWTTSAAGALALDADGRTLAIGGKDGAVVLRPVDVPGGWTATAHTGEVRALAFSADGQRLISGSADGTLRLWTTADGVEVRRLEGHEGAVLSVALAPDGHTAVSGGTDGSVRVWDLDRVSVELEKPWHLGSVLTAAVAPDGRTAATTSSTETRLWDLADGRLLDVMESDGRDARLVVGAGEVPAEVRATVEELDAAAGPTHGSDGNTHTLVDLAVTPDGASCLSASRDRTMIHWRLMVENDVSQVRLWDLGRRTLTRTLAERRAHLVAGGNVELYRTVAIDAAGRLGVTGGDDRRVQLWDLVTGTVVASFEGDSGIASCAISADGSTVVAGEGTGRVHLLRVEAVAPLSTTPVRRPLVGAHSGWIEALAVTPDGRRAVSASSDGTLAAWDLASGRSSWSLVAHDDWVTGIAVGGDGSWALTSSRDGAVKRWDLRSGTETARLDLGVPGWAVALSPDDRLAVIGVGDGRVVVVDVAGLSVRAELDGHDGAVTALAVSSDGRRVVSGSTDASVRVHDLDTGVQLHHLTGHQGPVWAVGLWGADRAVSAGADRVVRVWDLGAGEPLVGVPTGHLDRIDALAVAADGVVLTGSADGSVRRVDLSVGEERGVVAWRAGAVTAVTATPDGESVLFGGHREGIDVSGADLLDGPPSIRDRFTEQQWALVTRLPLAAWAPIAAADGVIDDAEIAAVAAGMNSAGGVLTGLLDDQAAPDRDELLRAADADTDETVRQSRSVLRLRLDPDEYRVLVADLARVGRSVAEASGIGSRGGVGDAEAEALTRIEEWL